jgi:tetrahydromethanopterin S-methyltransferase subunit B
LSTIFGAVLGVEVAPSAGGYPAAFYGFSIGWWVIAASVLALAVGEHSSHGNNFDFPLLRINIISSRVI